MSHYSKLITQNSKAQAILEYLLIIAVIVAAVVTMQRYAKRGVQAMVKVAADGMGNQSDAFEKKEQMFTQTVTKFGPGAPVDCPAGSCSSTRGTETTTEGISSTKPMPLTAAEYNETIGAGKFPDNMGNQVYYTFAVPTESTSTQTIRKEERAGGEKYTNIEETSTAFSNGVIKTESYEREQ